MTEEQQKEALSAIAVLDEAAARAPLNRQSHVQAQVAIQTLRQFVAQATMPDNGASGDENESGDGA